MNSISKEKLIGDFLVATGTDGWVFEDQGIVKNNIILCGYDGCSYMCLNAGGFSIELTTDLQWGFFLTAYSKATDKGEV